MAQRILYCATVDYHFKAFHLPYMKWLQEQGWIVDVAAAGEIDLPYTDHKYNLPIQRSPFSPLNIRAYQKLKKIINQNNYDVIHCHTPLGGVLARLGARQAREKGAKVIYTAHGFHFCKGSPWLNWLIYYPIEKYLAHHTDRLITINHEDFNLAKKHRFKAGKIDHVKGVGVDTKRFKPISKQEKNTLRKSFGYQPTDFLLCYTAEFNKNKNQQFLIHLMIKLKTEVPKAKLLLVGEGALLQSCQKLAHSLGVSHMVEFLGFRKDVDQILQICDLAVATSFREGLPVNVMEAMSCGIPVLASENRGHNELITSSKNGFIIQERSTTIFANHIKKLANDKELAIQLGENGRKTIVRQYSIENVLTAQSQIYQSYMKVGESIWATH